MDGVVLISKPKGLTSTRVVEKVRKRLKVKVGHTGTLDPIARGLLVLTVGKATRFSWIFTGLEKGYRVRGILGVITDTYDLEGEVLLRKEVRVGCGEVERVLEEFRGEIEQVPPPFSAKKVGGKRSYRLARKGLRPDLKPVKVKIYHIELTWCQIPEFEVYARVSSGTYMRSLINDIGNKLSSGAAVKDLTRESVGPFTLREAVELEEFLASEDPERFVLPIDDALGFLPRVSLDYFSGKKVLSGNPVLVSNQLPEGYVRIYIDETFVGVGSYRSGVLRPERLLKT